MNIKARDIVLGTTFYSWFGKAKKVPGGYFVTLNELKKDLQGDRVETQHFVTSFAAMIKLMKSVDPRKLKGYGKLSAFGWPLKKKRTSLGGVERDVWVITCIGCHSEKISMSSAFVGIPSGNGGTFRIGDNYRPLVQCLECLREQLGVMHIVHPFDNPPSFNLP